MNTLEERVQKHKHGAVLGVSQASLEDKWLLKAAETAAAAAAVVVEVAAPRFGQGEAKRSVQAAYHPPQK